MLIFPSTILASLNFVYGPELQSEVNIDNWLRSELMGYISHYIPVTDTQLKDSTVNVNTLSTEELQEIVEKHAQECESGLKVLQND